MSEFKKENLENIKSQLKASNVLLQNINALDEMREHKIPNDKYDLKKLSDKYWKYFNQLDNLPDEFSLTVIRCSSKEFFNLYGIIYVLHNIDELLQQDGEIAVSYKKFFNKVGSITVETLPYMQMTNSGRLQLNTSTYKGFDIIDADIQGISPDKNSALNIISDKTDSDNNINVLHLTSVNNQSIDT